VTVSPTPTEISAGMKHSLVSSHPGTEDPAGALTVCAKAVGTVNPPTIAKRTKNEPNVIAFIGKGS
jgi:hypothetical protein